MSIIKDSQFPICEFVPEPFTAAAVDEKIGDIEWLPSQVEFAISNLNEEHLHSPYRIGGWTIHELVHHIADSHMNAFIRCKLCLSEINPVIKPYDENAWVKQADVVQLPVNVSTTLLHALHKRWVALLRSVGNEEWHRRVTHPEHGKEMTLWYMLCLYSWHGRHHVAHITNSPAYKRVNG